MFNILMQNVFLDILKDLKLDIKINRYDFEYLKMKLKY